MFKKLVKLICLFSVTINAQTTYYVSDGLGKDSNVGSEVSPFKTIAKANEVMQSGDVCEVMQGVYRETVTPNVNNVTYKNYQNEYVIITGLDVIENWTQHEGMIYKASVSDSITQVFANGKRMIWARYPNDDGNMLNKADMININISTKKPTGLATLTDNEIREDNFWAGGYLVGVSNGRNWWTAMTGRIKSSTGKQLQCDRLTGGWEFPVFAFGGNGKGFIMGAFKALDVANEWVYQNGELFFQPESGQVINDLLIEGRTRVHGFNLTNKSGIRIEGLHFKAADIHLPQANNCVISGCTLRFPGTFSVWRFDNTVSKQRSAWGDFENGAAGIYFGGDNNLVENTYIGKTWTHGVMMKGNNNTVNNCEIGEVNWNGERFACVFSIGNDNTISNSNLHDSARDCIDLGNNSFVGTYSKRAKILNCEVHRAGLFNPDSGLLYTNHQSGLNPAAESEIAYNYFHDYFGPGGAGRGGIYLDNGSSGYTIHHNIVQNSTSGIHVNDLNSKHRPNEEYFYNNTFINIKHPIEHAYKSVKPDDRLPVINAYNNISNNGKGFDFTVGDNNIKGTNGDFKDISNGDFTLVASSKAIDAGVEVLGITDGFTGVAPDVGAFEFGKEPFTFGANLSTPIFLDEIGFAKQLSEGIRVTAQDIQDRLDEIEGENDDKTPKWETNGKWTISGNMANNTASNASLEAAGVRAWQQILNLTPNTSYTLSFDYEISNKDGGTNAGIRVSIHQGEFSNGDYSNIAVKDITTLADQANPESGVGMIEFTPTENKVFAIFHKLGSGGKKANAKVSNLSFQSTLSTVLFPTKTIEIINQNGTLYLNGEATIQAVYQTNGAEVRNENLRSGLYIVQIVEKEQSKMYKVLVH